MNTLLKPLLETILGSLKSRAELQLEVLALRQQLAMVAQRNRKKLRFHPQERWFWILLYRLWPSCLQTLKVFQPDTLVRWHRKGFSFYWRFQSRSGRDGRPVISREISLLTRTMSRDNVGWGAPRIHGELLMLGIDVSEPTVAKYCDQQLVKASFTMFFIIEGGRSWKSRSNNAVPRTRGLLEDSLPNR